MKYQFPHNSNICKMCLAKGKDIFIIHKVIFDLVTVIILATGFFIILIRAHSHKDPKVYLRDYFHKVTVMETADCWNVSGHSRLQDTTETQGGWINLLVCLCSGVLGNQSYTSTHTVCGCLGTAQKRSHFSAVNVGILMQLNTRRVYADDRQQFSFKNKSRL